MSAFKFKNLNDFTWPFIIIIIYNYNNTFDIFLAMVPIMAIILTIIQMEVNPYLPFLQQLLSHSNE